jgi:Protein of unknown function (DUF742)
VSDEPGESFADVLNSISGPVRPKGARGERRGLFRRRRDADADEAPAENARNPEAGDREAGDLPTGADAGERGAHAWVPGEPPTAPFGTPTDMGPPRHELPEPEPPADRAEDAAIVRPYSWTGGRTRPVYDLAVETLVSVGAPGRDPTRLPQYEHRAVAELCREPRSVAEVAALLSLPLGVARVLIGDMASQGTVVVHQTASASGDVPDMALMERVLSGLRRL